MIGGRKVLGLITARGGSKGVPHKNILSVGGKPLLVWTVDAGLGSTVIDQLILSSDDEGIMSVGRSHGCEVPFCRPPELATDESSSMDVVLHALDNKQGFDVVVLLQPTSPLRTAADIDAACKLFANQCAPACVSVCAVEQNPYWMYKLDELGRLSPLIDGPDRYTRRQDLPPIYVPNGAIYIADVAWLRQSRSFLTHETIAYKMPSDRSLDIDTFADIEMLQRRLGAP